MADVALGIEFMDSLPEWSKGVDSSFTSASCVGSNPKGFNLFTACNAVILEWGTICVCSNHMCGRRKLGLTILMLDL